MQRPSLALTIGTVLALCVAGAGVALLLSTMRGTQAQPSAASGTGLFPIPQQSVSAGTAPASPSQTGATDAERINILHEASRALSAYFGVHGTYPAAFADLYAGAYNAPNVDASYDYESDPPTFDVYSMCTTLSSADYECISSTLPDRPFRVASEVFDPTFVEHGEWYSWSTDGTTTDLEIFFPPGWTHDPTQTSFDLTGQFEDGTNVTLGRFNLKNYLPYSTGESLDDWVARSTKSFPPGMHVYTVMATTTEYGVPIIQQQGVTGENGQAYVFVITNYKYSLGFRQLAFFADAGMLTRLRPWFNMIFHFTKILPD